MFKFLAKKCLFSFILLILLALVNTNGWFAYSAIQGHAQKESEEEFVLFIVDFSNSMSEKLHGTKK